MTRSDVTPTALRHDAIRRMRRVATGILAALAVIYFGSFLIAEPNGLVLLVRAMAEAGMIGGIADWFAVEALFRHPLGLPIPHTALLPRNQQRAAANIARFIDAHFLAPEQLTARVRRLNPAQLLADWLSRPENTRRAGVVTVRLLHVVVQRLIQTGVGEGANRAIQALVKSMIHPEGLSTFVSSLLKETVRSRFMDDVITALRDALDGNRDQVVAIAQDRSRWWIPSTADRRVVKLVVDGFLSVLDELQDRDSDLRQGLDRSIVRLVDELHATGRIDAFIEEGRQRYLDSPAFATAIDRVLEMALSRIGDVLEDDADRAAAHVAGAFTAFAALLREDPALERDLNLHLVAGIEAIIAGVRPAATAYVVDVIETWDSDDLVSRIETVVGRDLQFIRINGAVLGACVGGVLHGVTSVWS